jgi:tetratricopeptide (TPR) repeat protein
MSTTLERIKSLRLENKHKEACELARALIATDERNADAWWYLALAQNSLNDLDDCIVSLKTMLKLAPKFAAGWAQYGVTLAAKKQPEQGLKALSQALQLDTKQAFAARQAARICKDLKDLDGEIHYLNRLDAIGQTDGNDLNCIGIAYWEKKHFGKAIDYYHRSASILEDSAPYFNLALVYNHDEVSQDVDAIDCLERALRIDPNYEKASKRIATIKPKLDKLAQDVLTHGEDGLDVADWFKFYINPFELLVGQNYDYEIEDYDTKTTQRLKKQLLQEIDLEDGHIHYMEGLRLDKSRAIGICESLNDENLKQYHWLVFSEPYLLNFLTRGKIKHFLFLDDYKPLALLEELDSEWSGFREWLSQPFAKQYDLVLTRAIQRKRVPLVESLFDGRRWILREHEELCFEGAKRQVKQIIAPLKQAVDRSKETKPTLAEIKNILNGSALASIINLLPEPFRDQQRETVGFIREISIAAFNKHGDTDLSKNLLSLSQEFNFKSTALTHRLEEDFKQINKLIAEERKHEAKLTLGSDKLEVTKDGVRQGSTFIAADNIVAIRWGVVITGTQYQHIYQFLMVCRDNSGNETKFSWQSSNNIEEQQKHFGALIKAAVNYVVPKIFEKIQAQMDSGRVIKIGPCSLSKQGILFEKSGWFSSKQISIPWSRVETNMSNGALTLYDKADTKNQVAMEIRDTENAVILQFLSQILKK